MTSFTTSQRSTLPSLYSIFLNGSNPAKNPHPTTASTVQSSNGFSTPPLLLPRPGPGGPFQHSVMMMYIGHTIKFTNIAAHAEDWLRTCNATWATTTIQSEHTKDLCWFVYSTKNTNCNDLGAALTKLLGQMVRLQFKTIQTGPPQKPLASAVHLLADKADTSYIMHQLNDIYSEARMNNCTTDYPLGQRLLLAPMTKGLNDNNLATLLQLKAKQASFCNQITTMTTRVIQDLDTPASFAMAEGTTGPYMIYSCKWCIQPMRTVPSSRQLTTIPWDKESPSQCYQVLQP